MATVEDVARLILLAETKGFAEAKGQISLVEGSLGALTASYKAGAVTTEQYQQEGRKLQGRLDELKAGYKTAEEALKKHGDTQRAVAAITSESTSKMAGFGQSMLQTGRVVQDFAQGGLGGILNNIEGLSMALGGGAGLAGVLTIVGVAAMVLKPQLKELWDTLMVNPVAGLTGDIAGLKVQIERLESKEHTLKFDLSELKEAQDRLKELEDDWRAFEATKSKTSATQTKVASEVQDIIAEDAGGTDDESGGENLARLMKAAGGGKLRAEDPRSEQLKDLKEKLKHQQRLIEVSDDAGGDPEILRAAQEKALELEHDIHDLEVEIEKTVDKKIGILQGRAAKGVAAAIDEIKKMYDENEELFTKGDAASGAKGVGSLFRFRLGEANAEEMKRRDKERIFLESQRGAARLNDKLDSKKLADARRAMERLVEGFDLDKLAADSLVKLRKQGGFMRPDGSIQAMTPDQMYDHLRSTLEKMLVDELKAKGLDTRQALQAASDTAGTLARKAESGADAAEKQERTQGARTKKAQERARQEAERQARAAHAKKLLDAHKQFGAIAKGGLQQRAEMFLAQQRQANPHAFDDKGQLKDQYYSQFANMIRQELRRGGVDPRIAASGANFIAGHAQQNVQNRIAGLVGSGMNAQAATQMAVEETQMAVAMLGERVMHLAQNAARLRGNARRLQKAVTAPSPTNLPGGVQ